MELEFLERTGRQYIAVDLDHLPQIRKSCHRVFDIDAHREVYGKLLLGVETPGALY